VISEPFTSVSHSVNVAPKSPEVSQKPEHTWVQAFHSLKLTEKIRLAKKADIVKKALSTRFTGITLPASLITSKQSLQGSLRVCRI